MRVRINGVALPGTYRFLALQKDFLLPYGGISAWSLSWQWGH